MKNQELENFKKIPYFERLRQPLGLQFRMLFASAKEFREERKEKERIRKELMREARRQLAEEHKDDPGWWRGWPKGAL